MKQRSAHIVVYSVENCRDRIVSDLMNIERYMSRWLKDRVYIEHRCVCASDVEDTFAVVDGVTIQAPTIASVLDAVQFSLLGAA